MYLRGVVDADLRGLLYDSWYVLRQEGRHLLPEFVCFNGCLCRFCSRCSFSCSVDVDGGGGGGSGGGGRLYTFSLLQILHVCTRRTLRRLDTQHDRENCRNKGNSLCAVTVSEPLLLSEVPSSGNESPASSVCHFMYFCSHPPSDSPIIKEYTNSSAMAILIMVKSHSEPPPHVSSSTVAGEIRSLPSHKGDHPRLRPEAMRRQMSCMPGIQSANRHWARAGRNKLASSWAHICTHIMHARQAHGARTQNWSRNAAMFPQQESRLVRSHVGYSEASINPHFKDHRGRGYQQAEHRQGGDLSAAANADIDPSCFISAIVASMAAMR